MTVQDGPINGDNEIRDACSRGWLPLRLYRTTQRCDIAAKIKLTGLLFYVTIVISPFFRPVLLLLPRPKSSAQTEHGDTCG